jgi:hypothetical protein
MTDYLMMIGEHAHTGTAAELSARLAARTTFQRQLGAACLDAGRLRPSAEGKRVHRAPGRVVVEDGPFDPTLESYLLLRADNLAAATGLVADFPLGPDDTIDIRPLMKGNVQEGKLDQPGKVFALSVLGNAPDEATWTALMDRIDNDTKDKLRDASFLGGVRLQPPTTGKRIRLDHTRRIMIDGPFLESKEVIGGLFFRRLASLDEAVQWASETDFVVHGSLEIRELWRT